RGKEGGGAARYAVDFIDYFPIRELGIALYQDGQYKAAVAELEKSLAAFPTAKAAYYYNLARAALLRQAAADPQPPRLTIAAPPHSPPTHTPPRGRARRRRPPPDPKPPRITIDAPADGLLTNALAMEVRG